MEDFAKHNKSQKLKLSKTFPVQKSKEIFLLLINFETSPSDNLPLEHKGM